MSDVSYDPRPSFVKAAVVLWLLGCVFALTPFDAYEAESFMLAILCVGFSWCFAVAVVPVSALGHLSRSPVFLVSLAFWALALVSVFLSEIPFVSFIYFCFFSVFPLSFLIVALQGQYEILNKFLGWGLVVAAFVLSVSCLVQYFFLPDLLFSGFVHWPLANPNSLAGLLSLGLFGAFGWMLAASSRIQSNVALVLSALLALAIFTTGSRGAFVGVAVVFPVFFLFARTHIVKHKRCVGAFVLLSLAGLAAAHIFAPSSGPLSPVDLVVRSVQGTQSLMWSRPAIWASGWDIIQSHFWTGTGIGTFFLYYPEVRSLGDPWTAGFMAHSDPLQFWVEMGVFAPALFYGFVVLAVVRTFKALSVLEQGARERIFVVAPMCALAAMILHAHVSFHFHVLPILMVGGAFTGFWFIQTDEILKRPAQVDDAAHGNVGVRWALAAPVLLMLGAFAPFQGSEILINRAYKHMGEGNMDLPVGEINRAGHLSGNRNARALVAASNIPLGILQLNAPLMAKDELQKVYNQVDDLLIRAHAANPRLVQIPYHRAELLSYTWPFLKDKPEGVKTAQAYLEDALTLDARHLSSRVKLANLYLRKGQRQEALDILKAGLPWSYKNQSPRRFLEMTLSLSKDLSDEETYALAAQAFNRYFSHDTLPTGGR